MNLFDPALDDGIEKMLQGIRSAGSQCNATPQVATAIQAVSMYIGAFFRAQRSKQLSDTLQGRGPNAQLYKMLRTEVSDSCFSWDLVHPAERWTQPTPPGWIDQVAFCQYLRWLERQQTANHELSPNDEPYDNQRVRIEYSLVGYPRRTWTIPQARNTGSVTIYYNVPSMSMLDFHIESELEKIPEIKVREQQQCGVGFDFNTALFYDHDYAKGLAAYKELPLEEIPFPTIVSLEGVQNYEPTVIRLKDFVMLHDEEGDGISFVDGVISLNPAQWNSMGYSVSLSKPMSVLFRGLGSDANDWTKLPRSLQTLITQVANLTIVERDFVGLREADDVQVTVQWKGAYTFGITNVVLMGKPEQ